MKSDRLKPFSILFVCMAVFLVAMSLIEGRAGTAAENYATIVFVLLGAVTEKVRLELRDLRKAIEESKPLAAQDGASH